ncbi:MAG: glycosyltransferase, partial [Actinomycetota bacterium]|nr:glycosyltransferase [Actinomycetota bacterium]
MRIVVVSAHYPPEFVSGGTLVPQRLARGLAGRGHDVWVYAGSLDRQRDPLETWQDRDPTGLPVRWIASWPWIGWSDRHNYDNPQVTADFATWLAAVRPEVVHLHSLQSLGSGLVEAAAGAGAAVVVTMHDFWWICARQFLADRAYRPCCLVVAAGACQCEVDRAWLDQRTARLERALARVDLVLVPSAIAAQVLEANGVAPGRIVVDENGLPPPAERAAAAVAAEPGDGELRLLYAGGPDRMKGADVVVAAAVQLAERLGWRLIAYGLDPATVPAGVSIEARPPFAEGELATVLAGADVLVVPSVMRETFSILTREALRCGVAVVTTDTLGPEEIVVDGHNGLVVPAADPGALARAIGQLLDHPDRLAALRAAAAESSVAIRPVEDQVRANEAHYQQLLD